MNITQITRTENKQEKTYKTPSSKNNYRRKIYYYTIACLCCVKNCKTSNTKPTYFKYKYKKNSYCCDKLKSNINFFITSLAKPQQCNYQRQKKNSC